MKAKFATFQGWYWESVEKYKSKKMVDRKHTDGCWSYENNAPIKALQKYPRQHYS